MASKRVGKGTFGLKTLSQMTTRNRPMPEQPLGVGESIQRTLESTDPPHIMSSECWCNPTTEYVPPKAQGG